MTLDDRYVIGVARMGPSPDDKTADKALAAQFVEALPKA